MSLQVWLPLNGDLHNQGLSNLTFSTTGATVTTNGKISNNCYNFNGSSSRIYGDTVLPNSIPNTVSIACWAKIDSTATANGYLCGLSKNNANFMMCYYYSSSSQLMRIYYAGSSRTTFNLDGYMDAWHHYAYVSTGEKLLFYIDGELKKEVTYAGDALGENNHFCIGSRNAGSVGTGSVYFKGQINDVRFYDHALSAKEVEELAKGLVLHYKLDQLDTTRGTIYDSSGYNNNGEIEDSLTISNLSPRYSYSTNFSNGSISGIPLNFLDNGSFTVSFWGYSTNWDNVNSSLRSVLANYATNIGFRIYRSANQSRLRLQYGLKNSDGTLDYSTMYFHGEDTLVSNTWQHFVVTIDSSSTGTTISTYRNGELYTSVNKENQTFNHTRTANFVLLAPEPDEGYLSDFRIYVTAFTAEQVKELYNTSMSIDNEGNIYARELVE